MAVHSGKRLGNVDNLSLNSQFWPTTPSIQGDFAGGSRRIQIGPHGDFLLAAGAPPPFKPIARLRASQDVSGRPTVPRWKGASLGQEEGREERAKGPSQASDPSKRKGVPRPGRGKRRKNRGPVPSRRLVQTKGAVNWPQDCCSFRREAGGLPLKYKISRKREDEEGLDGPGGRGSAS